MRGGEKPTIPDGLNELLKYPFVIEAILIKDYYDAWQQTSLVQKVIKKAIMRESVRKNKYWLRTSDYNGNIKEDEYHSGNETEMKTLYDRLNEFSAGTFTPMKI